MTDQTLREHAGAIMCDAARDVELHTIQEHLEDQAGERVDPMTIQDIADLISKASITIDWPDQPSETARLRKQLNRTNTERQTLAAELATANQQITNIKTHYNRRCDTLTARAERAEQQRDAAHHDIARQLDTLSNPGMLQMWAETCNPRPITLEEVLRAVAEKLRRDDAPGGLGSSRRAQEPGEDRRHAVAFNALTRAIAATARFVALSERQAITTAVLNALDADEPARRAQEPPMRAGQLARMFHETYEELAPLYGYRTREASAKPWDDVPRPNRELMIATCARVLLALFPLVQPKTDTKANLRTLAEVRGPGPGLPQVLAERLAQADAQDPAPTIHAHPTVAIARALRDQAGRRADEIRRLAETLDDGAEFIAAVQELMADHWEAMAVEALAATRRQRLVLR